MRNIEERRARSKAHYDKRASGRMKPFTPRKKSVREATSYKQVSAMDVRELVEQSTSRSYLVKTAMDLFDETKFLDILGRLFDECLSGA